MRCTINADPRAPAAARKEVSDFLMAPEISGDVVQNIVLVVSELVTNAIEAGATSIELSVDVLHGQVKMSVDDDTGGWPTAPTPNPAASRGRGLAIVSRLASSWNVAKTPGGKRITAVFATD